MRLQKFLSAQGIMSRRAAEEEIAAGRVKVNGEVADIGTKIDPERDRIEYRGKVILGGDKRKVYLMLNKPRGYLTSMSDDRGRPCVSELVSDVGVRVYPIGRLDLESEGLLLFTNDGDFANRVTHPRRNVYKTYIAHIKGFPDYKALNILRRGVLLDDGKTLPAKAEVIKAYPGGCDVKISIHEGRNRQIRRMFSALGFEVLSLCRTEVGNVMLGNIPLGRWRHLTSGEISFFA